MRPDLRDRNPRLIEKSGEEPETNREIWRDGLRLIERSGQKPTVRRMLQKVWPDSQEKGENPYCAETPCCWEWRGHTPSIAFRHFPPKEAVNQCLEFGDGER